MRVCLQYTSKTDKRYIRQAVLLRSQADAKRKGWKKIGTGLNKITYKKGRIVVKFAKPKRGCYLQQEVDKYFSIPRHYKKHFARIFGGNEAKIIQRYVPIKTKTSYSGKEFMRFDIMTNRLKIWDVSLFHNITILNNKPVIYDFGCCG